MNQRLRFEGIEKAISLGTLPGTGVLSAFSDMGMVEEHDVPELYKLIEPGKGKNLTKEDVLRVIEYFHRFRILRSSGSQVRLADDTVKRLYGITAWPGFSSRHQAA